MIIICLTACACLHYWLCFGRREIDLVRARFLNVDGTPRPLTGTVFYNDKIYPAALFPTSDGKWNVTISDTAKARKDRIVGLQLYDFEETDVFLRPIEEVYCGFTFREWIMWVPGMVMQTAPISMSLMNSCNDIPVLLWWLRIAGTYKLCLDYYGFTNRLDSPHSSPKKQKYLNYGRIGLILLCIWGCTIVWPHAK